MTTELDKKAEGYWDDERLSGIGRLSTNQLRVTSAFKAGYEEAQKWIAVSERLPEDNSAYLVKLDHGISILGFNLHHKKWNVSHNNLESEVTGITHWMPLPQPPKQEAE